MKRNFAALLAFVFCTVGFAFGAGEQIVTAQILDYEKGYIFFTTGDGFHVADNVSIVDLRTQAKSARAPHARDYVRVTFDNSGIVTKIELSSKRLPPEGDLSSVARFAVALSSPAPNPELGPKIGVIGCAHPVAGRQVTVTFSIQVPATTALTDNVYMTTDQSGWNSQAYRLDRVDALHYRTQLTFASGTILHYLFDRGSSQSIQLGENGLEQQPYPLCVGDADAQAVGKTIYHWGDERIGGAAPPQPMAMPTPYNPAPFPNLPTPTPRP